VGPVTVRGTIDAMLTCSRCRTVQAPAPFCSTCGTSLLIGGVTAAIPPPPTPQTRTSGMAITGFVLSFFCGVLGVIFSLIGLLECRKSKGKITGDGLAIAGIAVSILTTIVSILLWVWFNRFADRVERIGDTIRAEEARIELQKMSYRVKSIYTEYGELPTSMAPLTPSGSCCGRPDERCRGDFDTPAWQKLGFEIYGSQHFRYRLEHGALVLGPGRR
jgi:hypothetical protein